MVPRLPLRSLVLLLACVALFGCDQTSPTEPDVRRGLTGTWEGALPSYPAGEDWSRVRLTLQSGGDTVTGTLVSRNGVSHPVTGTAVAIG